MGGNQWISTHNLAIDSYGNAYVTVSTGADFPITKNVFQSSYGGGGSDWGVAKISLTGALLASTFIGGSRNENPDGIYIDNVGNVYISGETRSSNFPVSQNAFQLNNNGGSDVVFVMLSADFKDLLYSTYMGGSSNDKGRAGFLDSNENLYVTGSSDGNNWPTKIAFQKFFNGGKLDIILAKFKFKNSDHLHFPDSVN